MRLKCLCPFYLQETTLLKLQTEVETMESNYVSKVSDQASTIADNEKKIQEIIKEKSGLEDKAADLQKKLEESAIVRISFNNRLRTV